MDRVLIADTAGLFDGEGSVSLVRQRISRWPSPQVSVASVDTELVHWLRCNFGGSIVTKQPRKPNHSISYDWRLTDRRALEFLRLIRPYLVLERKMRRIDLLLSAYLACTPRNGRYTDQMTKQKLEFLETFYSLP